MTEISADLLSVHWSSSFSILCFRERGRWKKCHWSQVSCCAWNTLSNRITSPSIMLHCFTPSCPSKKIFLTVFMKEACTDQCSILKSASLPFRFVFIAAQGSPGFYPVCIFLQEQRSFQVVWCCQREAELRSGDEVPHLMLIPLISHQYQHWDTHTHTHCTDIHFYINKNQQGWFTLEQGTGTTTELCI